MKTKDKKTIITLLEPFNRPTAVPDHVKYGGGGIRTLGTGLAHTRFPSVLLRPLGHSSERTTNSLF